MRLLGLDLGDRRIGIAISDPSGTLARPLETLQRSRDDVEAAVLLARRIQAIADEDEGLGLVVVGLPRRLDGRDTDQTGRVRAMVERLRGRLAVPFAFQDERLTSHEADERLALRERDWRRRKARLDAAAAAIILQDYIDQNGPSALGPGP